jgi:hypothetical protein
VTFGQHVGIPSRCWLTRPGLGYKSVTTQIAHDAGLAPIRSPKGNGSHYESKR